MIYALGSVEVSAAPYLLTILTAFVACLLVFAVAALLDSEQDTWLVRAGQRARLSTTRMRRMLKRRGVDIADYTSALTLAQIREQVRVCQTCGLVDLCDRALDSRAAGSRSSFSFCPNQSPIQRYLASLAHAGA